jgi:hypothetical protein
MGVAKPGRPKSGRSGLAAGGKWIRTIGPPPEIVVDPSGSRRDHRAKYGSLSARPRVRCHCPAGKTQHLAPKSVFDRPGSDRWNLASATFPDAGPMVRIRFPPAQSQERTTERSLRRRSNTASSMRSGCRTQAGVLPRPRSAAPPIFACRLCSSGLPAISAFTTWTRGSRIIGWRNATTPMPGFNRRQRSRCARRFALWDNDLERLCRFASSAAGEWKSALFAPGTAVAYSFARYEQRGPLCCHSVRWCAKRCSKESHAAPCGGPLLH